MNTPSFFRHAPRTSRRGFTLMEMLIVLTIIALLMGLVIFKVSDLTSGAKPEKVHADLLTFKEMLASYQLDNGSLPTTEQGIKVLWSKPTVEPVPARWRKQMDEEVLDPWNHPYIFRNPANITRTVTIFSPRAKTASPIPMTTSATGATRRPRRIIRKKTA